jgi:hypothetical protein
LCCGRKDAGTLELPLLFPFDRVFYFVFAESRVKHTSTMATTTNPVDKKADDVENQDHTDDISIGKGDILQLEHTDPVLNAKMHLVNNAIGK